MFAITPQYGLGLIIVGVVTFTLCLVLSRVAGALRLLAEPGEHRLHAHATPVVGGLAMGVGLIVGAVVVDHSYRGLLPSLLLLCVVGALDDRYKLPSWVRFLSQGVAVYLMIKLTGVSLESLGYLSGESEWLLGRWATAMTIFASIGVINAVNMSDGHDGLAGCLVIITLLAVVTTGGDAGLSLIGIASILGFLCLNLRVTRQRASVFMGDAGSTMLGLLLAYLLIKHSQSEAGILPVTALWLLALPLIDAVAVLVVRPLRGTSPFAADRIHYHHQLVDRGVGVNRAVLIAVFLQTGLAITGIVAWRLALADQVQLTAFLLLFSAYLLSLLWFTRKSRGYPK